MTQLHGNVTLQEFGQDATGNRVVSIVGTLTGLPSHFKTSNKWELSPDTGVVGGVRLNLIEPGNEITVVSI